MLRCCEVTFEGVIAVGCAVGLFLISFSHVQNSIAEAVFTFNFYFDSGFLCEDNVSLSSSLSSLFFFVGRFLSEDNALSLWSVYLSVYLAISLYVCVQECMHTCLYFSLYFCACIFCFASVIIKRSADPPVEDGVLNRSVLFFFFLLLLLV